MRRLRPKPWAMAAYRPWRVRRAYRGVPSPAASRNWVRQTAAGVRRIRKPGGGRKRTVDQDATLLHDLEQLVEPVSRGDPESPLRWTCKSVRKLAAELNRQGHQVSHRLVANCSRIWATACRPTARPARVRRTRIGTPSSSTSMTQVQAYQGAGQPVISVDTKKKELVGDFKNGGRELRPQGDPEQVRVHDFVIPELGKATPYGVYDVTHNLGWVNVGIDHDTATFAVESIRRWWHLMGQPLYPAARAVADHRRWRRQQWLAPAAVESRTAEAGRRNRSGDHRLSLAAGHQQVEQDRASAVLLHQPELAWQTAHQPRSDREPDCRHHHQNRAQSPLSIGHAVLSKGIVVSDDELAQVNLHPDDFHGEWNYIISPRTATDDTVISNPIEEAGILRATSNE